MPQRAHIQHADSGKMPKTLPCAVRDVRRLTSKSVLVTLDPGDHLPLFSHKPGQRVTFCLNLEGRTCFRSYNLVNEVGRLPQVAVKQVARGGASEFFTEELQPGDVLNVAAPEGHLYDEKIDHRAHHLLLFAAGSGITPLISVAKHALRSRPDHRITLLYANSATRDIMFQQELDDMARSSRFNVFHILGDGATGEDLSTGRLDHAKLQRLLEDFHQDTLPEVAFVSGPAGFMDLVDEAAMRHTPSLTPLRFSFMQQPFLHPEDNVGSGPTSTLTVTVGGMTHVIDATRCNTILETADAAGLSMPANCRSGICHRCKGRLISGQTVGRTTKVPGKEVPKGYILCCQQRPASDDVEIALD